jgi:hypothetical protein
LFAVEKTANDTAFDRDLRAYFCCRFREDGIEGSAGFLGKLDQIGFPSGTGCSSGH